MKGLSILTLVIVAIACVVAQEESDDGSVLDFAADETAMSDDRNTAGLTVNCWNCHPNCHPTCVNKPPHHHYNHHHRPYSHQCPSCPPRPTCPILTCRPTLPCPKPTCPPHHCPLCPICPTKPTCPTCLTKPPCPTKCPTKPPHCLKPHPTLIGVCLDVDLGIAGK
ncbi:sperm mitochondrial-associated cysteine-rich protein-like [Daphnia pulicaria]|uniref:sperm mitochondrial-associated cysteine-rich protein-like n=1 Tax=Daphnia pulicaria TaxID=35523 RepID=UPI001EEBA8EF|nr:sperm mitochondrial-associated cysteine-rich protein-like [Daphnia pulicaria]